MLAARKLTRCLALVEGGCLEYPGGFHCGQPLVQCRILLSWLANPHNPAMSPHSRHLSTLKVLVEGKKKGRWSGGTWTAVTRKSLPQEPTAWGDTKRLRLRNQQHKLLKDTTATWNTNANMLKWSWNKPCESAFEHVTADQEKCSVNLWQLTLLKEHYHVFAHAQEFDFRTGLRIQRCWNWHRAFTNPFASSSINFGFTLKLLRIKDQWYTVLVKCQFVCNRVLSVLTSMPFDRTLSGRKCYGGGWRQLSFGSFQKGLENWERTEK